jgi:hypothetical protein
MRESFLQQLAPCLHTSVVLRYTGTFDEAKKKVIIISTNQKYYKGRRSEALIFLFFSFSQTHPLTVVVHDFTHSH